jgi:hypothetical protein
MESLIENAFLVTDFAKEFKMHCNLKGAFLLNVLFVVALMFIYCKHKSIVDGAYDMAWS